MITKSYTPIKRIINERSRSRMKITKEALVNVTYNNDTSARFQPHPPPMSKITMGRASERASERGYNRERARGGTAGRLSVWNAREDAR